MKQRDNRDAIDFSTMNVHALFRKMFIPTLLGMLGMAAVATIDGIFVGHGWAATGLRRSTCASPSICCCKEWG